MPLQGSGQITLTDIQNEFGGSNPIDMSEYYRGGAYVTQNNTNVPTSGTISMSNFYGGQRAASVFGNALWFSIGAGGQTTINLNALGSGYKTLILLTHNNSGDGIAEALINDPTSSLGGISRDRIAYTTAGDAASWAGVHRQLLGTAGSVTITQPSGYPGGVLCHGFIVSGQLVPYFGNSTTTGTSLSLSVSAGGITFISTTSVFSSGITQPSNLTYGTVAIAGNGHSGYRLNPTTGTVGHSWTVGAVNWAAAAMSYSVV